MKPIIFSIAGASISSAQHDDPLNEAERYAIFCKLEGHERLINFHNKAWDELWKSDIIIEGDDEAQQRFAPHVYHLYSFVQGRHILFTVANGIKRPGV